MNRNKIKNQKSKIKKIISLKAGYTLIEVLIASTIFTAVVIIGTSAFSTVSRIKGGGETLDTLNQTAIFVAEDLARNVRSATGIRDAGGNLTSLPFEITSSTAECNKAGYTNTGTSLNLRKGGETKSYFVSGDGTSKNLIFMIRESGASTSLLPTNIYLEQLCFYGNDYTSPNRVQPYVFFEFTLVDSISGKKQTIRSAVAGREYF